MRKSMHMESNCSGKLFARCRRFALSLSLIPGLVLTGGLALAVAAYAQAPARMVGSVTAVSGNQLTVKPDNGAPSTVTVSDTARILRTQPGAKKLADATPIALTNLTVGDRVLVIVNAGTATTVVAMKQADIAQKQAAEAADWQLRGTGGIVKGVDAAAGTITISSGARTLTIHTTPNTIIRRYSPDSAQFTDARPSRLDQIHPGDQLRVRGDRSADGLEINADGIIAGTFRDIAGTVLSTNPGENAVTIKDLATKKTVVIHITSESQLHKLPTMMAEGLAARLKRMGGQGSKDSGEQHGKTAPPDGLRQNGGNEQRGGRLSQMLEETPIITLSDLHKGNALMIVATQGTPGSATAVTLLAGVEPILDAFPSGSKSVFSASWNLSGSGAGAGAGGGGGGGAP